MCGDHTLSGMAATGRRPITISHVRGVHAKRKAPHLLSSYASLGEGRYLPSGAVELQIEVTRAEDLARRADGKQT